LSRPRYNPFLSSPELNLAMMLPGLIPLAFYKRKPTAAQVVLGLASTVVLSAYLG